MCKGREISLAERASRTKITVSRLVFIFAVVALIVNCYSVHAAATTGPERTLAGIRIYSPATLVLKKYGNPTRIITGSDNLPGTQGASPSGPVPPMPVGGGSNEFGGNPGGSSGSATSGTSATAVNEVTYEYAANNGNKLDFLMSADGRVIQITAAGFKNPLIKTARNITLGSTYSDVVTKYGYPEAQDTVAGVITTKYTDRAHVAFQLFQNKVVSITVAAVE